MHRTWLLAIILTLAPAGMSRAGILVYELGVEFSGGAPPTGSTPWLRATLNDFDSTGSVELLLENLTLVDDEFVSDWYFNLDPALDPTSLVFSNPVKTGSFADPSVDLGTNAHQADGDGKFDVRFNFAHAKPHRFGAGESALITISGIATLNVNSFHFISAPGGANGGFGSAAHVQGIGDDAKDSGWVGDAAGTLVAVPEPASVFVAVLLGAGMLRRRPRSSSASVE